jgi:hypothetical protein
MQAATSWLGMFRGADRRTTAAMTRAHATGRRAIARPRPATTAAGASRRTSMSTSVGSGRFIESATTWHPLSLTAPASRRTNVWVRAPHWLTM